MKTARAIRSRSLCLLVFLLILSPGTSGSLSAGTASQLVFSDAPSSAVTYNTNQVLTFELQALDPGSDLDTAYNGSVTLEMRDSVFTGDVSDSRALIGSLPIDATATTGTAILVFNNGVLNFGVLLRTPYDGESVYAFSDFPEVYAGSYLVQGKSDYYYLKDATDDTTPATYPPDSDQLTDDGTPLIAGGDVDIVIPESSTGPAGALSFSLQDLTASYASAGAQVLPNLWVRRTGNAFNQIQAMVIIDTDGDLSDHDAPDPLEDVIVVTSSPINLNAYSTSEYRAIVGTDMTSIGVATFPADMITGRVVVRVWREAGSDPAVLRLRSDTTAKLSGVRIPYSFDNASFVMGDLEPGIVLSGSPASVTFMVRNLSNVSLGRTEFRIPANTGGVGTPWTLSSATGPAGAVITSSNPSGSTDGWVNVDWTAAPVPPKTDMALTLAFSSVSSQDGNWTFDYTVVQNTGGSSEYFDSSDNDIQTLGAPPSPASLDVTPLDFAASGERIGVAWDPVTVQSCDGYVLERRSPAGVGAFGEPVTIEPNSAVTFTSTATNLASYEYRVMAKNLVSLSAPVTSAPVTAFVNPGPPTGVTALSRDNAVTLSWTAPVSVAGSMAVAGYEVYRGTAPGVYDASPVGVSATADWTDNTASNGTRYYYAVRTVDTAHQGTDPGDFHESVVSAEVSGYPPGNPPTGLAGVLSSPTSITLTWTAPAGNVNAPVSYVVYRNVNADPVPPANAFATIAAPAASFGDDDSIVYGSNYRYIVTALDGGGVESNLSAMAIVYVRPSAPIPVSATATTAQITVNWGTVTGQGVTRYVVYKNATAAVTVNGESSSSWTDTSGLVQGVNVTYYVTAVNSGGEGDASVTITSAILPPAPEAMTALTGGSQAVTLEWMASSYGNVTGVDVSRNTTDSFAGSTPVTTNYSGTLTFVDDTGLSAGTTYFYYLQYRNPGGASPGYAVTGLMIPPNPPTGIVVSPSSDAVTFTWAPNAPSENVTRYHIWRSTTGDPFDGSEIASPTVTTYTDTGAAPGVMYYYAIVAENGGTYPGGISRAEGFYGTGRMAQVPTPVIAILDGTSKTDVLLSWEGLDSNVISVTVYVNTVDDPGTASAVTVLTGGTGDLDSFVDVGKSPGTRYYYWVRAVNNWGPSPYSTVASILIPPSVPALSAPSLSGLDGVILSWTQPGGETVSWFEVTRAILPGAFGVTPVATPGPTASTVTLTAQPRGQQIAYRMVAVNAGGTSDLSVSVTIVVPPSVPANRTAASGLSTSSFAVTLGWNSVTGENVTGYTVYRADVQAGPYARLDDMAVPGYTDNTTTEGSSYWYLVNSEANGTESVWNTSNAVAVTAYRMPNTPTGLVTEAMSGAVSLAWNVPAATTYPVAGYQVCYASSPSTPVTTVTGAAVTVTGLANGVPVSFVVRTLDSQGHIGAASSPVTETPVAPPGAPGNLVANRGNDQVVVDWDPSPAGSLPVSYYVVYRNQTGVAPFAAVTTVPVSRTWYVDTGIGNSQSYFYIVRAADNSGLTTGTHMSGPSNMATANTDITYVNPPTDLVASSAGSTIVHLVWTAPNPAGLTLTGIRIYRSTSPAGPWVQVGTAEITALSHDDSNGLEAGTAYYYVVRAVEQAGAESSNSNVSDTVTDARSRPMPPVGVGQCALDANLIRVSSGESLGIYFQLDQAADVEIHVYNIVGDLVSEVHFGRAEAGVRNMAEWDLTDRFGTKVSSGGYLVEITAGPLHQVLKVAVVR